MADLEQDVALVRRALEGSGFTAGMGYNAPAIGSPNEGLFCVPVSERVLWWRVIVELARRAVKAEGLRHGGAAVIDLSHLSEAEREELRASFARNELRPGLIVPLQPPYKAPPGWPADEHGHALQPEGMTPEQRLHLAIGLREAMERAGRREDAPEDGRLVFAALHMLDGAGLGDWMRALGQEVGDADSA